MSYTPHLRRGGELYHWRPKGSRNGYSNDPNYKPIGQKAQGQLINGRYVYDNKIGGAGRQMGLTHPVTLAKPKQNIFQRAASGAKSAGNWLVDRGGKAVNAAGKAASSAGQAVGKAANDTRKWVGDRGRDVGNFASKTASNVGKGVSKAAKDISKTATKIADDVTGKTYKDAKEAQKHHQYRKEWATDYLKDPIFSYQQEKRAERAVEANKNAKENSKKASDYASKVRNSKKITSNESKALGREDAQRIGNILNANAGRAATAKKSAEEQAQKAYNTGKEYREWVQENADKQRYHAGKEAIAKRKMNDSLYSKVDKAKESVENTTKNASEKVSKAAENVKEKITGNKAYDEYAKNSRRGRIANTTDLTLGRMYTPKELAEYGITGSEMRKDLQRNADAANAYNGRAAKAKKEYDNSIAGRVDTVNEFIKGIGKNKKKETSKSNKPIETKPIETKPIDTKPIETKTKIDYEKDEKNGIVRRYDGKVNPYLSTSSKRTNKYGSGNAAARNYQKDWERGESYIDDREKNQKQGDKISSNNKAKKSSNANPKVSKEYEEEMAYNNQKNNYFGFTTDAINSIDGGKGTFTYDQSRGETVYIDKNGKKHYAK